MTAGALALQMDLHQVNIYGKDLDADFLKVSAADTRAPYAVSFCTVSEIESA
jgi:hypothetical protein